MKSKKGNAETNEAFGSSLDFTANGTQAIGADVADFSTAEVGTYEDTIDFTAALADIVTYTRTNG